jgi:hypothetical protein
MGPVNELDDWVAAASEELGLAPGDVQTKAVLNVARDVAHEVLRPAAPVTAYLMGVAVGRGADPAETAERISALARAWHARESTDSTDIDPAKP